MSRCASTWDFLFYRKMLLSIKKLENLGEKEASLKYYRLAFYIAEQKYLSIIGRCCWIDY